jgi:hypothetical protein
MTKYEPGDLFTMNPPKSLWRISGDGTHGPVTIKVRAVDYFEAVKIANTRKMVIRDVVLVEDRL